MRTFSRYLFRLHLGPFVYALTGLTLLLLLDQVAKRFGGLVGKGLHWSIIGEVFLYSIPFILAQTFPMAVLIAVLYVFNRLALDFEITAMKASGIPLVRLLIPLLVVATLLAGTMTWFNNSVLPDSNHRLQMLLTSIAQKKPTFTMREQAVNEVLPTKLYVQVARIDRARSSLEDVEIYDSRDPTRSRIIEADSATMAIGPNQTNLFLTLFDGELLEQQQEEPETFQRTRFGRLVMRVEGVSNELRRDSIGWRSDREMNIADMAERVRQGEQLLARGLAESRQYASALTDLVVEARKPPQVPDSLLTRQDSIMAETRDVLARHAMPANAAHQFDSYRTRVADGQAQINKFSVEIHKKYTIPAACIVFVLVGAPIAIRFPNGGLALVMAVSLGFFSAYYVALVAGEELSDARILSPLWAMWAPNVLFGILGIGGVWWVTRAGR